MAVDGEEEEERQHLLEARVHGGLAAERRIVDGADAEAHLEADELAAQPLAAGMAALGAKVVRAGLELSAPLVGVLFVVNAVMGLLARVSPQMNIFSLVQPVAMGAALVAAVAVLPSTLTSIAGLYAGVPRDIAALFGASGGR